MSKRSNVVPFPKATATIKPLYRWQLVNTLDCVRGELTNGQPWQPARMTEVLRRVSQLALTLANQIEQAGEVRPRRRWVIRRAPRRAPPALPR